MADEKKKSEDNKYQTMRDAAKWLLAALGAIGTVLIAGVQLTDIGTYSPLFLVDFFAFTGVRFFVGIGAFVVGLGFLIYGIRSAVAVLLPVDLSYDEFMAKADIVEKIDNNPSIIGSSADSVTDLNDKYNAAAIEYRANQKDTTKKEDWEIYLDIRNAVHNTGHYYYTAQLFSKRINKILFSSGVVAVSVLFFSIALKIPEKPQFMALNQVTLELSDKGLATFKNNVSSSCQIGDDNKIGAVVLMRLENSGWEVVTLPRKGCAPIRMNVLSGLGKLLPSDSVPGG